MSFIGISLGEFAICVLIAIASSYLVWQVATGDLTEDQ